MFIPKETLKELQAKIARLDGKTQRLSDELYKYRGLPSTPKMSVPMVDCEGKLVPNTGTCGGPAPGCAHESVTLGAAIRALVPEGQELVYCRGSARVKLQPKRGDT